MDFYFVLRVYKVPWTLVSSCWGYSMKIKAPCSEEPRAASGESLPPPGQWQHHGFRMQYLVLLLGGAVGNECCSNFVSEDDFIEMLNPQ